MRTIKPPPQRFAYVAICDDPQPRGPGRGSSVQQQQQQQQQRQQPPPTEEQVLAARGGVWEQIYLYQDLRMRAEEAADEAAELAVQLQDAADSEVAGALEHQLQAAREECTRRFAALAVAKRGLPTRILEQVDERLIGIKNVPGLNITVWLAGAQPQNG